MALATNTRNTSVLKNKTGRVYSTEAITYAYQYRR